MIKRQTPTCAGLPIVITIPPISHNTHLRRRLLDEGLPPRCEGYPELGRILVLVLLFGGGSAGAGLATVTASSSSRRKRGGFEHIGCLAFRLEQRRQLASRVLQIDVLAFIGADEVTSGATNLQGTRGERVARIQGGRSILEVTRSNEPETRSLAARPWRLGE